MIKTSQIAALSQDGQRNDGTDTGHCLEQATLGACLVWLRPAAQAVDAAWSTLGNVGAVA